MIDIIFVVVVIVSAVVFLYYTRKTRNPKKQTKKKKQKSKKNEKEKEEEIPASWRKNNPGSNPGAPHFKIPKPTVGKIHVPGLRTAWRLLIALLLVINFFISQATLLSAQATQPMFWLFFLNSAALLWSLWKTRR